MDQATGTLENDTTETQPEDVTTAQANIETNRAQMTSTINALKEKLDPNVLTMQARENIQTAVVDKTHELVDSAKESVKEFANQMIGGARGVVDHSSDATKDALSNAGTAVQTTVGNAGSAAQGALGNVADTVKGAVSHTSDTIQGVLHPSGSPTTTVQTNGNNVFFDTIKANPLPVTLLGVGLVWLLVGAQQASHSTQPTYGSNQNNGSSGNGAQWTDQIKDKAGDLADSVQDKAGDIAEAVQDKTSGIQDAVSGVADKVQTTATQFGTAAQTQVSQASSNVGDWMQSNPLIVGAAVMGVGIVAGLLLPGTPQENQLMGAKRDELVTQTEQTVRQTISQKIDETAKFVTDKVESVTQELVKTT